MPKPTRRLPRPRRNVRQQVLWGTLYALIIACAGLLGYLGLGWREAILATEAPDIRVPAEQRGVPQNPQPEAVATQSPLPRSSWIDDTPTAKSTTAASTGGSFYGIPVE